MQVALLDGAGGDQPIAEIQDQGVVLARVRVGEPGQPPVRDRLARVGDQRLVQGALGGAGLLDRAHFRALEVGAQEIVADREAPLGRARHEVITRVAPKIRHGGIYRGCGGALSRGAIRTLPAPALDCGAPWCNIPTPPMAGTRDSLMGITIGTRLYTWFRGEEVGRDLFGNRYFREKGGGHVHKDSIRKERRWVLYRGEVEASRVPAEWQVWLHHTGDRIPPAGGAAKRPWQKEHVANLTGTAQAYRPPGHTLAGGRRARGTGDYEPWTPG